MNELVVKKDFTQEELRLIKDTVAKRATDSEFQLFVKRCIEMELNPLLPGQVHFIKYDSGSPGSIVVGIDGLRAKANRTGKLAGISRGLIRDKDGKCIGAWAEVHRTDWKFAAKEEVSLHEYNTGKSMWAKMPETMIKKVAEAAALRMAFPDELSGAYTSDEIDVSSATEVKPAQKIVLVEDPLDITMPEWTTYRGKKLSEIPRTDLEKNFQKLQDLLIGMEKNDVMFSKYEDLLKKIDSYLAAMHFPNK